jgi:hypothetical protein
MIYEPYTKIRNQLVFTAPFQDESQDEWTFRAITDQSTEVVWSMEGKNDTLMKKLMSVIMNFDAMIGKDFEEGLLKLKNYAEAKQP